MPNSGAGIWPRRHCRRNTEEAPLAESAEPFTVQKSARQGSLRRQVIGLFAATVLVLLVFGLGAVLLLVRFTEQQGWSGRQREATQRVVQTVNNTLVRQQNLLLMVDLFGRSDLDTLTRQLHLLLENKSLILEVVLVSARGEVLANAARTDNVLANLFTIPQSKWFTVAATGHKYVGDVRLQAADAPYLVFAVPAQQGQVVVSRLHLSLLQESLADFQLGRDGTASLVNREGQILAHSDTNLASGTRRIDNPELLGLIRSVKHSWHGSYRNEQGRMVETTIIPVAGTPWVAVTELPRREAYAVSWSAFAVGTLAALLFCPILGVLVTWLLNRRFLEPIQQLEEGVQRVSRGDLHRRVDLDINNEIGRLATSFNTMAVSLEERDRRVLDHAAAVEASEARYRAIVEDQTELICRYLPDGTLTFVNGAYCRYFKKTREELVGRTFLPFIPPEDLALMEQQMASLNRQHPVTSFDHRVVLDGGETRWHQWTDRAIFDGSGRIIEYAGVGRDITAQVLSGQALEQARTAAEAASRAKSQFLANMSHEIRTPMNAILGMSRLALEEMDHDRRQHLLAIVLRSAESLLGLLNDILDLSRIEAGRVQLNPVPFALGPLLDDVVATLAAPAADKGIALDVELAPDLPAWMVGDELRVRQVLVNLLNNAIKFTPAGSVRLHAHRREADGRPLLQLTVTDTGPGIPAEQLDRIFERFEQADNSLTRSHGGTGLGLAICRQLVALMGGKIWVESRLGAGSSFHCTLPLQPAEAPARVAAAQAVRAVSALHILLVDDSEVNREVATMTLEGAHRVTGAGTGLEALALLAQADFDVVLMDVQMPEMDGLAATVAIRAAERGETLPAAVPVELARALATRLGGGHVPIVAMTAHAMDEDRDRCLAAGMDSYLSKPFRHDQLARVLGAVVGDRAEAERAAAKPSPPEDPGR